MIEDNRRFWFHAKKFGWGWGMPATWQGWMTYVAYLALILGCLVSTQAELRRVVCIVSISVLLIIVVILKGERPLGWRWGKK
jgi:hypothetical protein